MISFGTLNLTILVIFTIAASIQFFYYFFIYLRLTIHKRGREAEEKVPVSVVICAKNEAANLEKYLPIILEQDYSNFEVIVVNDCSEDETEDVLKRYMLIYPRLRTTFIKEDEKFRHGKKLALTVGIKSAKNEWMLLTDADCFPTSNQWLAGMARHFNKSHSIVLGYGGYKEAPGLLNMLIRYDSSIIAMQYFSMALSGFPYMGIGRNLAYKKSIFFANKGFASHVRLDSGDDDLFINEVATSHNVLIETASETHTRSLPKKNFEGWVEQKKRHFTTFVRYKKIHKILLGGEVFSRILFYFSLVGLLILFKYWIVAVSIFFVRTVVQFIVFKNTFKRLNERNLLLISPIFDIILPFISFGIYVSSLIRPSRQWR